jgi:hypothetical protein
MKSHELKDDLLTGVPAIAAFLGKSPRQVYYLAETEDLPAEQKLPLFKIGSIWHARRSKLVEHIAKLEGGKAA